MFNATKSKSLLLASTLIVFSNMAVGQEQPADFLTEEFLSNYGLGLIRAQDAYAAGFTGKGVTIAIVDSPMQLTHPEFQGRVVFRHPTTNFPISDAELFVHGTHVAGIAGAAQDGRGMMGVAFDAALAQIALDYDNLQNPVNLRASAAVIESGASVMNGSFGNLDAPAEFMQDGSANPFYQVSDYTAILENELLFYIDQIRTIDAGDVAMIFSAGNSQESQPVAAQNPFFPAFLPIITPQVTAESSLYRILDDSSDIDNPNTWKFSENASLAQLDLSDLRGSMIAVAAIGMEEGRVFIADFTNYCGLAADWCIAAPGWDIYSTYPVDTYDTLGGTSMAAPHVTGVAALVRQAFPYMTARQAIEIVLTTADDPGLDPTILGHGLVNASRAVRGPVELGHPSLLPNQESIFAPVFAVDTKDHDSTWSNDISGTGGMSKAGAGTLRLTGNNTYTGSTSITGGKLQVDGSIALSELTVGQGATVSGRGILGPTFLMGTIAPGNSIGTLTVNGDLTFASGSTYNVELGTNGTSDRIVVNGDASIMPGAIMLITADGVIPLGTSYSVLTTTGTVSGSFETVRDPYLFMDFAATQEPGSVSIASKRNATPMTAFALNANQFAVAQSIDTLPAGSGPLANLLLATSPTAARTFFTAYSGEIYASQKSVHLSEAGRLPQVLSRRMTKIRRGAEKTNSQGTFAQSDDLSFWAQPYGSWGELSASSVADRVSYSGQGLAYGAEMEGESGLRLGVAMAFTGSHVTVAGSKSSTDAQHLMAYGAGDLGPLRVGGGLIQSWMQSDVKRSLPFGDVASAKVDSRVTQAFSELSLPRSVNSNLSWEPYLQASYSWLQQSAFLETGSDAALTGLHETTSTGTFQLGARIHHSWTTSGRPWDFDASASIKRSWGDTDPTATLAFAGGSSPFVVRAPSIEDTSFALDVSLGAEIGKAGLVDVGVSSEWGQSRERHEIKALLKWVF